MRTKTRAIAIAATLFSALTLRAQQPTEPDGPAPKPGTAEYELFEIDGGNYASISSFIELAGAAKAIPILEARFETSKDPTLREWIASQLWKNGDRKLAYSDFLLELAREAVESPKPFLYGTDGKVTGITPEFFAWAKAHDIPEKNVPETARYGLPGRIVLAAEINDPHSSEIFRQGLDSPNFIITIFSAKALAKIQDLSAIPLLIDFCANHRDLAPNIAFEALIYFDDDRAEAAARKYMDPKWLKLFGTNKLYAGKDPYSGQFPTSAANP